MDGRSSDHGRAPEARPGPGRALLGRFLLAAAAASGAALPGGAAPGPAAEAESKGPPGSPAARPEALAALDREIEALEAELGSLCLEEDALTREVEELGLREAVGRRRAERAAWLREEAARSLSEEERRCAGLDAAAESARGKARAVLRETYKQGPFRGYSSLLAVGDPSDILRAAHHLAALARRQGELLAEYAARREASRSAVEALKWRRAALAAAAKAAAREQVRLEEDRADRRRLLDRVRGERTLQAAAAAELSRAAEALAGALRALPGDAPPPRVALSFGRLRGGLPWPAQGEIASPFGSVRHPRFGTVTPHPGLEIRVRAGAPVRAIAAGRVVFNRRHGGYGRTVVVDHGERYVSVYARLAASTVFEGDEVLPGTQVGFAGEPDAEGKTTIYLEVRHQGRALDPAAWLRRARGARGAR
jgi:septal ring factor EnvC (AmiA/AmiB activator)